MKICAILLSYKRPQNIQRILDSLLAVEDIDTVVISNNNPAIDLRDWIEIDEPRLDLVQQAERAHCIKRFEIAAQRSEDYFICPDDDVFLTPEQISNLIQKLQAMPKKVHGFYGQIQTFTNGQRVFGNGVSGLTCEVDIINRAYFFTKEHVNRMYQLVNEMGIAHISDAIFFDDLLLSFCGQGRAVCHNIGPVEDCPTSHQEGVATFTEPEFDQIRLQRYTQLQRLVSWSVKSQTSPHL